MSRIKLTASALALALALGAQVPPLAHAQEAVASKAHSLAPADLEFVLRAAQDGMAEMKLGQLAQEKAGSDEVKAFGQKMVEEHGKANEELATLIEPRGTQPPESVSEIARQVEQTLAAHSGEAFDRAYMAQQVAAHEVALAMFRHAAEDAEIPGVREFAQSHLSTIEQHLEEARSLKEELDSRT